MGLHIYECGTESCVAETEEQARGILSDGVKPIDLSTLKQVPDEDEYVAPQTAAQFAAAQGMGARWSSDPPATAA